MSVSDAVPARVIGPYLQPLLDTSAATGIGRESLLNAAGLPPDLLSRPVDELPAEYYPRLLKAASALSRDPGFGLRIGEYVRPGTYGVLGISLLSCATLGVAMQQVLRFESLVHDLGRSTLEPAEGGRAMRFIWHNVWREGVLVDAVFSGMIAFAGWLTGRPIPLLDMELQTPVLPLSRYEAFYRAPVRASDRNAFLVSAELMAWPLPQADPSLLPVLEAWAERLMRERSGPGALIARLRQVLREGLPAVLTVEEAAKRLHVSTRTLQRRLQEADTGFVGELEAVRKAMAEDYLRHSALSISEIAYLLGYREASSFSHAFRAWHGRSPLAFRRG